VASAAGRAIAKRQQKYAELIALEVDPHVAEALADQYASHSDPEREHCYRTDPEYNAAVRKSMGWEGDHG
jgi:hypothetical protein